MAKNSKKSSAGNSVTKTTKGKRKVVIKKKEDDKGPIAVETDLKADDNANDDLLGIIETETAQEKSQYVDAPDNDPVVNVLERTVNLC